MKGRLGFLMGLLLVLSSPIGSMAGIDAEDPEDVIPSGVTGYILEIAPDNSSIQVGDHNYIVGRVMLLSEEGEPKPASRADLRGDDIVHLTLGERQGPFWNAEEVIIYRGNMRQKIAGDLLHDNPLSPVQVKGGKIKKEVGEVPSSSGQSGHKKIFLHNGVWHN